MTSATLEQERASCHTAGSTRDVGSGIEMKRAMAVLVTCGALLGYGAPASSAPAAASWGFFNYTGDFVMGLNNARWARATGVLWASIEKPPGSGQYDWSALDAMVVSSQAAGMSGVIVLKAGNGTSFSDPLCYQRVSSAPDEAFPNGRELSSCPVKAAMEPAWEAMVKVLVERYDGDGNADMPGWNGTVKVAIQVENEAANWELWDYGEGDRVKAADHYLQLLKIAYRAKRAAAPGMQVILAGLMHPNVLARCDGQPGLPGCDALAVQRNLAFTKRILSRPTLFDAVDVHVFVYYHFEPSYIDEGLQWVANRIQQTGYPRPVYCLEWTASSMLHVSSEGYGDPFAAYFPYSDQFPDAAAFQAMYAALDDPQNAVYRQWFEAEQGKEFGKLFANMLAAGASRLINVQYSDFQPGAPWDNVWWNWQGIIKYVDGTPIRKPSYYTYNLLSEALSGFATAQRVGPAGDVRLYRFTFAGAPPAYVFWTDGPGATLDLSSVLGPGTVRITHLVTELDAANEPVVLPDEIVPATAVPVGDVPVLLLAVD